MTTQAQELVGDGLMTIQDASRFLSVSRGFVYKLMEGGDLPYVKLGRSRRIPRRAVVELAGRSLQGGARR